jgi:hypothetical protein
MAQAITRVSRTDTTFFICRSQSRERRMNRLSRKWESPLGENLGLEKFGTRNSKDRQRIQG